MTRCRGQQPAATVGTFSGAAVPRRRQDAAARRAPRRHTRACASSRRLPTGIMPEAADASAATSLNVLAASSWKRSIRPCSPRA
eukprot:8466182-Alexandrium_andersonii.AAC.1